MPQVVATTSQKREFMSWHSFVVMTANVNLNVRPILQLCVCVCVCVVSKPLNRKVTKIVFLDHSIWKLNPLWDWMWHHCIIFDVNQCRNVCAVFSSQGQYARTEVKQIWSKCWCVCLPHKVKRQCVHCRLIASYFLFPWKNPAQMADD